MVVGARPPPKNTLPDVFRQSTSGFCILYDSSTECGIIRRGIGMGTPYQLQLFVNPWQDRETKKAANKRQVGQHTFVIEGFRWLDVVENPQVYFVRNW